MTRTIGDDEEWVLKKDVHKREDGLKRYSGKKENTKKRRRKGNKIISMQGGHRKFCTQTKWVRGIGCFERDQNAKVESVVWKDYAYLVER